MSITLKNLTKSFGEKRVIDNLSMEIPKGSVCLFGPSGCGKTTLLNILAGLVKQDRGEVLHVPKKVSFVFQQDRLIPWAGAYENVQIVNNAGNAAYWLEKMGLMGDMQLKPSELSGGMIRRVAIARALNYDGDLFLMDEPFKGLDKATKDMVMRVVKEQTQNKNIIFVTHDYKEAKEFSDIIIELKGPPLVPA